MSRFRTPKWSAIPTRLLLFVVLPLVIVLVLTGLLVLHSLNTQLERRLEREVEMVARALRLPAGHALRNEKESEIQRSLESALRIGRVYGASIFDSQGELVAAVGGAGTSEDDEAAQILERGQRTGGYRHVAGRKLYSYFVPLTGPGDQIIGVLQVTRTRRDMRRYMRELRWWAIAVVAATTAAVVVVVLLGYYVALGRSLGRFREVIESVQSGSRERRAVLGGPREIAAVARAFNAMLDSIEDAELEIKGERQSRYALEDKLRQTEKLAAIGRLAAGVAHELGTPLSIVDGCCQQSLRRPDLDPRVEDGLIRSREEVRRMERLVRQLLDFGRPEPRDREWTTASRALTLALASVIDAAAERGVEVTLDQAAKDVKLCANLPRLEQALVNVLENAIQAARSQVRARWREGPERVSLEIDDDGPGIPAEQTARLFEPFFTTKPVGEGTGLGLSIAHSAVTEHDGLIEIKDSPLGGARVILNLPNPPAPEES